MTRNHACAHAAWPGPLGAYGLALAGLDGARAWMHPVQADAPVLRIEVSALPADPPPLRVDPDEAVVALRCGGRLSVRRGEGVARFALARTPSPAELLHPYLAAAAALVWQWAGHEALHAGAFALDGAAVLLLGARESGKTTTLRQLAGAGLPVLSDDLAIVVGDHVLAGPRALDVRRAPGDSRAPASGAAAIVRSGERSRLTLGPAPASLPFGATVVLEWGPSAITAVGAAERPALLAGQRSFPGLAPAGSALLDLAARPMLRFRRPRDPATAGEDALALLERLRRPPPRTAQRAG